MSIGSNDAMTFDAMTFVSKSINDCAVVACCAIAPELSREQVIAELEYTERLGCKTINTNRFLESRGYVRALIPRRGQNKMCGIVRFASYSKSIRGHLALIADGLVYDAYVQGMPIKQYQLMFRHNHVTHYWRK